MPRKTRQKWKPFDPNVEESSELRRSSRLEAKGPSKRSWAEVASPLKNPKISRYERLNFPQIYSHTLVSKSLSKQCFLQCESIYFYRNRSQLISRHYAPETFKM